MDPSERNPSTNSESAGTRSTNGVAAAPARLTLIPTLIPGELLAGRFTIVRFISRGGMGEVYEAADDHLQGKRLALKTLLSKIGADPVARQRFEREVLVAREIRHPNVCPTYDLFREVRPQGSFLFLTMKLLAGEPLNAILARREPFSPEEALPLLRQMAAGLDAAHSAGIVHRDFKPGNVMIDSNRQPPLVTITDFGLSRPFASGGTLTGTGHIAGTPGYIAPEIIQGAAPSPASDVYAFGLVMREMTANPPAGWQEVIQSCLDSNLDRRPQRASKAVALLEPAERKIAAVLLPRRGLLMWSAASAAAAAAGVWYGSSALDGLLHPLPEQRFVALMPWPPGADSQNRGLLRNVLDAIESRLTRAEATAHNLLVISSADPRNQAAPDKPADAPGSLGANLVLAASLASSTPSSGYELGLRVLDSATSKVLRSGVVKAKGSALSSLLDQACALAARLLDVPVVHAASSSDEDELARLPARPLQMFSEAEDLVAQPNDSGLDGAIEKYQKVLELQPGFALGYAQLARAYARKYFLGRDPAELSLARRNADQSRKLNPVSNKAQLSEAIVSISEGKSAEAVEILDALLRTDPANPHYAYEKAIALRNLGRHAEEQAVYREIIRSRPNYWPAYNDLGSAFYGAGRNEDAAKAFSEASVVAPKVALPLANLGAMYLALGRKAEAADAFRRSLDRAPNDVAYSNLGSLDFENHAYQKALANYDKARSLKPNDDDVWRNIADCEAKLGHPGAVRAAYAKASAIVSEKLEASPHRGDLWMLLAFYRAKSEDRPGSDSALRTAEQNSASDVQSQFLKAQTLATTGRNEESLNLVLGLLKRGLPPLEVEWALDLDRVRADARYKKAIERK